VSSLLDYFILFAVIGVAGSVTAILKMLTRIEAKLNRMLAQVGADPQKTVPPGILGLLQAGRKIEAIKAYREATGVGLKEAKEAVEAMEANRIITP
jgi:ribosomal protein L7/L12